VSAVLEAPGATWMSDARQTTPENAERTRWVLECAGGWEAGTLPLGEVLAQCTGWERFIALNHVGKGSPERELLMRLLDALIAYVDSGGAWQTKHGRFTREDLAEYGGMMVRGQLVWPEFGSHGRGWHYREPKGE
jgi:hypothetical protein